MKKLITLLLSVSLTLACVFATGCTNFSASFKNEITEEAQLTKLFEDNKTDFENLFTVVDKKDNNTVGVALDEKLEISLKSDSIKVKFSEDANLNVNVASKKVETEPVGRDEDNIPNGNVEASGEMNMNLEVKGDYFKLADTIDEENPVYANTVQLAGSALYGKTSLSGKVYFDNNNNLFLKGSMNFRDMLEGKGQVKVNVGKVLGLEQKNIAFGAFEYVNMAANVFDAETLTSDLVVLTHNGYFKVFYNDKNGLKLKIAATEKFNDLANAFIDEKLGAEEGEKFSKVEFKDLALYIVFDKDGKLAGIKFDVDVKGSVKVKLAADKTEDVAVKVKGSATLMAQTDKVKKVNGAKDYVDITSTLVNYFVD